MNEETKPRGMSRFIQRGGGFYLVLAVCVVVLGGMMVLGVMESVKTPSSGATTTTTATTTTRRVAAAGRATSVRDERTTVATTAAPDVAEPAEAPQTLCVLPLSNAVVQGYSEKPVYWGTLDSWRVHLGVDFAGQAGDPVKAASDGTVSETFHDALWGDVVILTHGSGQTSTYCGVTATCAKGDTVKAGEAIGTLSAIPCESGLGPHLHFEWNVSGEAVDPLSVLQGEVRFVEN